MQSLSALVSEHVTLAVFAMTLASRLGLPVPAPAVLILAGAWAAAGHANAAVLVGAAIVANLAGDGVWFMAGRRHGHRMLGLLCRISLSPDSCVRRTESFMMKWGAASLIAAKFVPGISLIAAPMAGAIGMSLAAFVTFDVAASALWSVTYLGIGLLLSEQVENALDIMAKTGTSAVAVALLLLAGFLGYRYWRRVRLLRSLAMPRATVDDVLAAMRSGAPLLIVDARLTAQRSEGHNSIPGSVSLEEVVTAREAGLLAADLEAVVYCDCPNEVSAASLARKLSASGMTKVRPLAGGFDAWLDANQRVS